MTLREFRLPDLGEGLTESDLVSWHVAAGDRVELNQVIAEVETAKALVDLPSPYAGVVAQLHAEAGQTVNVGEPLVTFEVPDAAGPAAPDPSPAAPEPEEAPQPNLVGYGARPERSGHPTRRRRRGAPAHDVGDTAERRIDHAAERTTEQAHEPAERPRSTPPVRMLAKKLGVHLDRVDGTGPDGLVTREDVLAAVSCHREVTPRDAGAPAAQNGATGSGARPRAVGPPTRSPDRVPPSTTQGRETRIPVRGVRKHTAAAMVASAFTAPHATVFLTVDVTESIELLERLRTNRLTRGTRITVLALVARALCVVLERHPALNARWEEPAGAPAEIVQPHDVHLGVAVATDRGLVVPNVPAAQELSLPELADALGELTETARAGRTAPERLRGGTITVTNVGVFGVDAGTPILNPGEAAILGVGAVRRLPWEHRGEVALRQVATLSLSFDHRIVDGEQGARFLADLGALLADPGLALLGAAAAPGTRSAS
ncbi:dihydrolipoamide acetyltransferase family protein [Oerskovia flava]|uniref:dihydrolipoamide acetyltransferase family protein n=1 Tax=Oerskovia flava TaxID=2986422 RepID=UPI0022404FF7|nr:dihydrolipoamide acetyltransferase family protein [Oerskovia sp. JB1-3-2]